MAIKEICIERFTGVCPTRLAQQDCLVAAGTLINAPMNRLYVLTADHCFIDKTQINNFRYWRAQPFVTSLHVLQAVNRFHISA